MKKIALLASVVALGMGFTACDSYDLPEPKAPVNEQQPLFSSSDITVTPAATTTVDCEDTDNLPASVVLADVSTVNLPDDYTLVPSATVYNADDTRHASLAVSLEDGEIVTTGEALYNAVKSATASTGGSETVKIYFTFNVDYDTTVYDMSDTTYGPVTLSVTMPAVNYAYDCLYTPGDGNSWGFAGQTLLPIDDYYWYVGFVYIENQFKLTPAPNWNNGDWGLGNEDGVLAEYGSNIPVTQNGLYYVKVSIAEMSYELTYIESIECCGDVTGDSWNPGSAQKLTATNSDMTVWSGDITFTAMADNSSYWGWKFTFNQGWDINLGGSLTDLQYNGDNIDAPGIGTYTVTLDLSSHPYTTSYTAK